VTTFPEIVSIMQARRRASGPLINACLEVKRRYNGEWVLPLPFMDDDPEVGNMGPALIAESVEHLSRKSASVRPGIYVPALDPGKQGGGRTSPEWADIRRKALSATWFRSKAGLSIARAYRHFYGYATYSLMWVPDFDLSQPRMVVRDPLTAFPEPKAPEDITLPGNVGFISSHSVDWIMANYPQSATLLKGSRAGINMMWDLVEWIDPDEVVIGILGPRFEDNTRQDLTTGGYGYNTTGFAGGNAMELRRWPNRAGCVPAVCPAAVTMDKIISAVARNLGQSDLIGRLQALDIVATERAIFPDRYVLGKLGQTPSIVGGRWKDGREGETNIVLDATAIGELHNTPDPTNKQAIDRAERNYRVSTGLVPQAGGESYGALRTGRGMDALMQSSVDPRVGEGQENMEYALGELNRAAIKMYKGYWGSKSFSMYSGWPGDSGHVKFTPDTHFESEENVVAYPVLGTDRAGLTVELGQLLGAKGLSLRSFRRKHPDIDDPEGEEKQVLIEAMQNAVLTTLLQHASDGSTPPEDLAKIGQQLMADGDIFAAAIEVGRLAQERQATMAPPPGPGQVAAPETMPGLGPAGAGQEQPAQPAPPIGPPPASLQNLHQLVRDLKTSA